MYEWHSEPTSIFLYLETNQKTKETIKQTSRYMKLSNDKNHQWLGQGALGERILGVQEALKRITDTAEHSKSGEVPSPQIQGGQTEILGLSQKIKTQS